MISIKQEAINYTLYELQNFASTYKDYTQTYIGEQKQIISKILEIFSCLRCLHDYVRLNFIC